MKFRLFLLIPTCILLNACNDLESKTKESIPANIPVNTTEIIVLGTAQDAGYPQAGCKKSCCQKVYSGKLPSEKVSCIAVIDHRSNQYWMIDATPDFPEQLRTLETKFPEHSLGGIFLTHAHIGHYTGLMHLGREAMGAKAVKVFAMPQMEKFLKNNGPWSQLVELRNIELIGLISDSSVSVSNQIEITPMLVPHRDEFSETVGFSISGGSQKVLFIPDIDKWEKWDRDITQQIQQHDYALLDGSFYANGEIPGRDMSEIPHPFVEESMELFQSLSTQDKTKIHFIHFNHTNPILDPSSDASIAVIERGMSVARADLILSLD